MYISHGEQSRPQQMQPSRAGSDIIDGQKTLKNLSLLIAGYTLFFCLTDTDAAALQQIAHPEEFRGEERSFRAGKSFSAYVAGEDLLPSPYYYMLQRGCCLASLADGRTIKLAASL